MSARADFYAGHEWLGSLRGNGWPCRIAVKDAKTEAEYRAGVGVLLSHKGAELPGVSPAPYEYLGIIGYAYHWTGSGVVVRRYQ